VQSGETNPMGNGNIISLAEKIKEREKKMEEEVERTTPFAEATSELMAEFLFFCRERRPTLNKFCDLLCDELRNGAEKPLLEMAERLKKTIIKKKKIKKKIKQLASLPKSKKRHKQKARRRQRRK